MAVSLIWQGPVGPGMFPNDPLMFENLCAAGVYVRVKTYRDARLIAYAGQSVSLLARFDQHLTSMLSLSATLRDESGATIFIGDAEARLKAYGDLARASALAAADAARIQFWYALCDDYFHDEHLNLVEGLLQRRIGERVSDIENRAAAPGGMPDDAPDRWENDFSGLDAASRDVLTTLLGPDVMTLR
jgi:hypothetical protein